MLVAPRSLNEPTGCRFSHLSQSGPSSVSTSSSGVRRTAPAMRAAASVMSVSETSVVARGPSILGRMARYTLVYGLRLVEEGSLVEIGETKLRLKNGETAGLTLHTIDGTIPQLRRALDRSLDAFFEFLPGATDEDRRDFDDS